MKGINTNEFQSSDIILSNRSIGQAVWYGILRSYWILNHWDWEIYVICLRLHDVALLQTLTDLFKFLQLLSTVFPFIIYLKYRCHNSKANSGSWKSLICVKIYLTTMYTLNPVTGVLILLMYSSLENASILIGMYLFNNAFPFLFIIFIKEIGSLACLYLYMFCAISFCFLHVVFMFCVCTFVPFLCPLVFLLMRI